MSGDTTQQLNDLWQQSAEWDEMARRARRDLTISHEADCYTNKAREKRAEIRRICHAALATLPTIG